MGSVSWRWGFRPFDFAEFTAQAAQVRVSRRALGPKEGLGFTRSQPLGSQNCELLVANAGAEKCPVGTLLLGLVWVIVATCKRSTV